MDFSQIDHPDHLEKAMSLSQPNALEPQARAPAPAEPRSLAADRSASAHKHTAKAASVSGFEKTLEDHGSIVDVRSLDDEVAEPPVPGSKDDIDKAVERTLEQSSSGASAPAVDQNEVGRGEDESPLSAGGGTNSIVVPPQSPPRELTLETLAPSPTAPQSKVAAPRKPKEIESCAPDFLTTELEDEEAADVKPKAEAKAPTEAEAQPCSEAEAAQAKAEPRSEEKAPAARAAEDEAERQAAEEQAPREARAQRQAADADTARMVIPSRPVERPATTTSNPVTAPPAPQLAGPTALELVRAVARNRPSPDGEAAASRLKLSPEAQVRPDATMLRDDPVQTQDSNLSGPPSPRPVQPEQPVQAQPAQRPRTIDEMSREELEPVHNELVAKELQIRTNAAGIPVGQFREFSLPDQIILCGGAGLPRQEEQLLAAIKGRLSKLSEVVTPASASEPARPLVSSPAPAQSAPAQPAPKPPIKDDPEGMTRQQFDSLRKRGFGRD